MPRYHLLLFLSNPSFPTTNLSIFIYNESLFSLDTIQPFTGDDAWTRGSVSLLLFLLCLLLSEKGFLESKTRKLPQHKTTPVGSASNTKKTTHQISCSSTSPHNSNSRIWSSLRTVETTRYTPWLMSSRTGRPTNWTGDTIDADSAVSLYQLYW